MKFVGVSFVLLSGYYFYKTYQKLKKEAAELPLSPVFEDALYQVGLTEKTCAENRLK